MQQAEITRTLRAILYRAFYEIIRQGKHAEPTIWREWNSKFLFRGSWDLAEGVKFGERIQILPAPEKLVCTRQTPIELWACGDDRENHSAVQYLKFACSKVGTAVRQPADVVLGMAQSVWVGDGCEPSENITICIESQELWEVVWRTHVWHAARHDGLMQPHAAPKAATNAKPSGVSQAHWTQPVLGSSLAHQAAGATDRTGAALAYQT